MGLNYSSRRKMINVSTDTECVVSNLDGAIMDGNFIKVKEICETETPTCNVDTIYLAAKKGNVKILKYLRERYYR